MGTKNIERFREEAKSLASMLSSSSAEEIILFHHNDTDGLTSAAILVSIFMRRGISFRRICLEKPYPLALEMILGDPDLEADTLVLFTDFASGMLDTISKINVKKLPIVVLDHHTVSATKDSNIKILNPLLHGISGSAHCSSSVVCYEFAKALDPRNSDLAHLAFLGAVGDGMHVNDENLIGQALKEATQAGITSVKDGVYSFKWNETYTASQLVTYVDALGSFGYFNGGTDVAIKGLLEGFDGRYVSQAEIFKRQYETALSHFLNSDPLKRNAHLVHFKLSKEFDGMGVKTVGLVCHQVKEQFLHEPKYVLGFQDIPNNIPGLGPINLNQTKLSARVSPPLESLIRAGKAAPVNELLLKIADRVRGFFDASHIHAGAITINRGMENECLKVAEELVRNTSK